MKFLKYTLVLCAAILIFFSAKWTGFKFVEFQLEKVNIEAERPIEEDEDFRKNIDYSNEADDVEKKDIILTVIKKTVDIREYRSGRAKVVATVYEDELLKTIDYFKNWFRVMTTSGEIGWVFEQNVAQKKIDVPAGVFPVELPTSYIASSDIKKSIAQKRRTGLPIILTKSRVAQVRLGPSNFYKLIDKTYRGELHNIYAYNDGWFEIKMPTGEFGWVRHEHFDTIKKYNPETDDLEFGSKDSFETMFEPLFTIIPKSGVLKLLAGPEIDFATVKEFRPSAELTAFGRSGQNWYLIYDNSVRAAGWARRDSFETVVSYRRGSNIQSTVNFIEEEPILQQIETSQKQPAIYAQPEQP